jgi:CDP-glycerol glycerophosphotransferase
MLKAGLPWIPRGGWMAGRLGRRARAAFGTIRPISDIGPEVSGALQVMLWHGMPIKGIGLQGRPTPCHFPEIDRCIATSSFTSAIQRKAFDLPEHGVFCSGEPKTDAFVDPGRPDVLKQLGGGFRKIVLYAPTYRDEEVQVAGVENSNLTLLNNLAASDRVRQALLKHDACMIIALHPFLRNLCTKPVDRPFFMSWRLDACIEYLMAASSFLISDFSSVIIDWLLLSRPMSLYCPDLSEYKSQRGFPYFDFEHMFGKFLACEADAVAVAIDRGLGGNGDATPEVEELRRRFHVYPAGGASRRIYDAVLREVIG